MGHESSRIPTYDEIVILDKFLKTLKWSVAADEPLDGGVRTFARDLSMILRDAEKQKTGVNALAPIIKNLDLLIFHTYQHTIQMFY